MSGRDGGPAYPIFSFNNAAHSVDASGGMSLRQAYKLAALQGITANPNFFSSLFQQDPDAGAQFAAKCADACIAEDAEFATKETPDA